MRVPGLGNKLEGAKVWAGDDCGDAKRDECRCHRLT